MKPYRAPPACAIAQAIELAEADEEPGRADQGVWSSPARQAVTTVAEVGAGDAALFQRLQPAPITRPPHPLLDPPFVPRPTQLPDEGRPTMVASNAIVNPNSQLANLLARLDRDREEHRELRALVETTAERVRELRAVVEAAADREHELRAEQERSANRIARLEHNGVNRRRFLKVRRLPTDIC